jgi:RNA polymerase sigma-70 factor (ECF subfamily)
MVRKGYVIMKDEELVAKAMAGDQTSYTALMEKHKRRLYGDVYRMLRNHHDAEEVVAWAFSQVFRELPKYQAARAKFYTWLYKFAKNRAICVIRKRQRTPTMASVECEEAKGLAADGPSPGEESETRARDDKLHKCLDKLEPRSRRVLEMLYWRDLSLNKIARELDITPRAAMIARDNGFRALLRMYKTHRA